MDVIVSSIQRHHQSPHGQQQSSTMKSIIYLIVSIIWLPNRSSDAFTPSNARNSCIRRRESSYGYDRVLLFATADEDVKSAPMVTGAQLEVMLTEWEIPLVIDAYATWCGPCLLMSPEFEAAAKELDGKVRFVKLDTDQEEEMATRLAINGLPTLLFLDKYVAPTDTDDSDNSNDEESSEEATAVLKGRIEGALRKENIIECCEHYFFDGPEPKM